MRKFFFFILFTALSLTMVAQQKSVAVLEPICRDNSVGTFYHQIIRGSMESAVTATDEYVSYDRTAFDKVLEEHEFQRSGVVDDDQIRKMGAYAGVDYVLVTELSGYEGYLNIIVKIINIETGESSKSLNELTEQQPKVVQSVCQDLAKRLFGIIDFSNGIRKGTLQLPEGRYTGEIQNGKPQGKGIIFFNDSNAYNRVSYEGDWQNGVISGQGTMVWKSGERYEGGWFNGQKSGTGTIYSAADNGASKIVANFVKGDLVGDVTMYAPNGNKYVGPMPDKTGKMKGTMYHPDGSSYTGEFNSNFQKHGKGILYTGESKITGNWKKDELQGFVQKNNNDGSEEHGNYLNGKPDGEWTRRTAAGNYQKARFSNGVMTSSYR